MSVEIAVIMEDVSGDNNINSDTALKYLQRTTATLQTDYNNKDQQLACSVVSISADTLLQIHYRIHQHKKSENCIQ